MIAPFPSTSATHQCPGASTPHAGNTTLQSPITLRKLSFLTQPHLTLSPHLLPCPLKVQVHSCCSPRQPPFSYLLTWLATAHLLGPCSNVTPTPSLGAPPREPALPPASWEALTFSGASSPSEGVVLGPRGQGGTRTSLAPYPGQSPVLGAQGPTEKPTPSWPGVLAQPHPQVLSER